MPHKEYTQMLLFSVKHFGQVFHSGLAKVGISFICYLLQEFSRTKLPKSDCMVRNWQLAPWLPFRVHLDGNLRLPESLPRRNRLASHLGNFFQSPPSYSQYDPQLQKPMREYKLLLALSISIHQNFAEQKFTYSKEYFKTKFYIMNCYFM